MKSVSSPYCLFRLAAFALILAICSPLSAKSSETPVYGYRIVNTYPHNTESFTQGLVIDNGTLYEGTGLNGRSAISIVDITTGDTIKSEKLAGKYFGEGITIVDDKIVQLTWRAQKGFVYDKSTLKPIKTFKYQTQGWGITYDGKHIIMSDGTDMLYFMDPRTYKVRGKLEVYDRGGKVSRLNELEYIDGKIYANVWGTEKLAIINPKTGQVVAWVDLSGLLTKEEKKSRIDVLNGIAYDKENQKLYVTGKLWPKLFEIEIVKENN